MTDIKAALDRFLCIRFLCIGIQKHGSKQILQDEEGMIHITELPIRKWTQDYKEYLESLIKPEDKGQKPLLSDYKEFHTGANVHFELQPVDGAVTEHEAAQLLAKFKLTSRLALSTYRCLSCQSTRILKGL